MQKRTITLIAGFISFCLVIQAQSFQNKEFVRAVQSGSRTQSGIPGESYFQNHTEYQIHANFDPSSGELEGKAKIIYTNNSPDTLRRLVFRLYHNFMKEGGIRDMELSKDVIYEGVEITGLSIEGNQLTDKINKIARFQGTNMKLILSEALIPGATVNLEISWELIMPDEDVHRFGKYDEGCFFVAYWYPQVSVYDDIARWDELNYNGTQEFYNDFNSYDVKITVPGNHMVWATGEWLNADEILSESSYKRYLKASTSDEVIGVIEQKDLDDKSWRKDKKSKTYHFKYESIPDFAFAVADKYLWDMRSVAVDSVSNRRVTVGAVYPNGSKYFDQVAEIGGKAINHFADSTYGVPYPYPGVTVFNGQGGMEFPMMINDGETFMLKGTIFVTMHEIAHAYFPFLTGLNERKYAWMDEGLTTYLPVETEAYLESDQFSLKTIVRRYELYAGTDIDVPPGISSYSTRGSAYYYQAYSRSTLAFYMLERFMGKEAFRTAIVDFINIWQYKHPTPYDFFNIMKKHSTKELDWFIDQWFFNQGWPDLGLENVSLENGSLQLDIRKKGSFAVPVELLLEFEGKKAELITYPAEYWKDHDVLHISRQVKGDLIKIKLNDKIIPDSFRSDNIYEITSY